MSFDLKWSSMTWIGIHHDKTETSICFLGTVLGPTGPPRFHRELRRCFCPETPSRCPRVSPVAALNSWTVPHINAIGIRESNVESVFSKNHPFLCWKIDDRKVLNGFKWFVLTISFVSKQTSLDRITTTCGGAPSCPQTTAKNDEKTFIVLRLSCSERGSCCGHCTPWTAGVHV